MRQASNLKNLELDLLLPGFSINTSRSDYCVVKEFRMMRFNGERWEPFGPTMAVGQTFETGQYGRRPGDSSSGNSPIRTL